MQQIILGQNQDGTFNILIPSTEVLLDKTGTPVAGLYTESIIDPATFDNKINDLNAKIDSLTLQNKNMANDTDRLTAGNLDQIDALKAEIATVSDSKAVYTTWAQNNPQA